MKKVLSLSMAFVLMLMLAACGVPQEKLDSATAKYDELVALCDRAEVAVQDLDAMASEGNIPMGDEFDVFYNELDEARDSYAAEMEGLDKKKEAEVDALIEALQGEIDDATPVVKVLEDIRPEFETMLNTVNEMMTDLNTTSEMAGTMTSPSQELIDMFDEVGTLAGSMESELNDVLAGANEDDPASILQAFKDANVMMSEMHGKVKELLAQMELEGGAAAA